jgi:hypothetical protein
MPQNFQFANHHNAAPFGLGTKKPGGSPGMIDNRKMIDRGRRKYAG